MVYMSRPLSPNKADSPIYLQLLFRSTHQVRLTLVLLFLTEYLVFEFRFSIPKQGLKISNAICKDRYPQGITPLCQLGTKCFCRGKPHN